MRKKNIKLPLKNYPEGSFRNALKQIYSSIVNLNSGSEDACSSLDPVWQPPPVLILGDEKNTWNYMEGQARQGFSGPLDTARGENLPGGKQTHIQQSDELFDSESK